MKTGLGATVHLLRAGLVILAHDAFCPPAYQHRLPWWLRLMSGLARALSPYARRDANTGVRLARALEGLGPAYIKLGQLMSMRPDIFGLELTKGLETLKDALPAAPDAQARKTVEAELGQPVETLFTEFGPAAAAASLAQVHKATTPDGQTVAVKILRPGIEARVARDLDSLRLAARWVRRLVKPSKRMKPEAFVETVARSMELELDLRLEAAGCAEFRTLDLPGTTTPAVVWGLSAKRVLTLSWLEGEALNRAQLSDDDRQRLATIVMQSFLKQALTYGVFHADSHEGNLLVTPGGQLGYVDFGIMGRLSENERVWLARILWGFLARDYHGAAQAHFDAGYVPSHHRLEDFAQALRAVGEPIFGQDAAQISMGRVLEQLFDITALYDMELREELILLQKTMVAAEGAARALDPNFDMWATSKPVVESFLKSALSPTARLKRFGQSVRTTALAFRDLPQKINQIEQALSQPRHRALWPWALLTGLVVGAGLMAVILVMMTSGF